MRGCVTLDFNDEWKTLPGGITIGVRKLKNRIGLRLAYESGF